MARPRRVAVALSTLFSMSCALAQQTPQKSAAAELPPVVVTANPLGSELFELVPPVSVLDGRELFLRREATLGETLDRLPGVSSTAFGPNASRPVIRGLDGDRVRLLQNGVGVSDASSLSFDHAVSVDPLLVERVEVVRGPAALLYGGTAIGGVVNTLDNRIPLAPVSGVGGRAEARFGGAADERGGAALLEAGNGRVALHADGYTRRTDDLRIAGRAVSSRLRAAGGAEDFLLDADGRQPNSSAESHGGGLGVATHWDGGRAGVSWGLFDSDYGTVAEEAVRIDMRSRRWDVVAELDDPAPAVSGVKFKFGRTDYQHAELEDGEVGTTFLSDSHEARVELNHAQFGLFTGMVGVQLHDTDFSALGDEAFVPGTRSRSRALFVFEEARLGAWKLDLGGRLERASVRSEGGGARFGAAQDKDFTPVSVALGALYSFTPNLALAANLSHSERAPTFYELFANGPHVATGVYELGDDVLAKERSNALDLALRWRRGPHSASVGVFHSRFGNYLALASSGNSRGADGELNPVDGDGDGVADGSGEEILPEFAYQGVPAALSGFEAEGRFRLLERGATLDLELRGDYTRAKRRDTGEPLPRIPPLRVGAALDYRLEGFGARLEVNHARRQNRVGDNELPTDGYTLANAALFYRFGPAGQRWEAFLRANNLFDREARNHVSFLKDIAPLPGRGVLAGVRATF